MIVETQYYTFGEYPDAFKLESGRFLSPVTIAYETYGRLNNGGDNAILIVHGFTADAHAAGVDKQSDAVGWWDDMIGSGKAFDTDQFFVVSTNVIGGCSGSTGPASINPTTGKPYGSTFPVVTISDMVNAQYQLLKSLGITSLASVSGASMGGQQALQWMISYPNVLSSAIPIACSARLSAMSLAISELSRNAIVSDPAYRGGDYYETGTPERGLIQARMAAHLTYISGEFLDAEFGRRPWIDAAYQYKYQIGNEFAVQNYLRKEGESFVKRFDANAFLYLSQAIEYFDITKNARSLTSAFEHVKNKVLLISFRTDWLFPVAHLRELEMAMREAQIDVNHITVETTYGHDAFLTDWRKISPLITEYLATV